MIREMSFVIAASRPWNEQHCNDVRNMAEEIATTNKVLYLNPPTNGVPVNGFQLSETGHQDNFTVSNPKPDIWVLESPVAACREAVSGSPDEKAGLRYAEIVSRAAAQAGILPEKAYLLLDNCLWASHGLAGHLKTKLSVFYRNDRPFPECRLQAQEAEQFEKEAACRADIVVTNSVDIASKLRRCNHAVYNIGRGVDLSGYQLDRTYPRPADIADIGTKIIGCAGTVCSMYISTPIIYRLALAFPDATVVMMGEKDPLIAGHPVYRLPNVRFLGPKSCGEMPAYISAFDVCIDPAVNKHPNSRYRNAVVNYLALGKSVICSNMAYTQQFCDYVMTADSEKEFIEKVSWAMHTRLPWSIRYRRAEFARMFSWRKCVDRLFAVIFMAKTGRIAQNEAGENSRRCSC